MQCGAKQFLVKMMVDEELCQITVNARTQIAARKTIRNQYGASAHILSVREKTNRSDINE